MTKSEAVEAMKKGSKLTHNFFGSEEWITMEGNSIIVTEEGYACTAKKFWKDRSTPKWDTGWSVCVAP